MNLLSETLKVLSAHKKSPTDVLWVGAEEYGYFSWEEFEKIADVEYDSGFGGQEVAGDLLVVGKDFWLERHEYDGSEWWEYKTIPNKPNNHKELKALTINQADKLGYEISCGWETLQSINGEEPSNDTEI